MYTRTVERVGVYEYARVCRGQRSRGRDGKTFTTEPHLGHTSCPQSWNLFYFSTNQDTVGVSGGRGGGRVKIVWEDYRPDTLEGTSPGTQGPDWNRTTQTSRQRPDAAPSVSIFFAVLTTN